MSEACQRILEWSSARASKVVCICNAHSVVTASQDPNFMQTLVQADLATPDGAPVAWLMRRTGAPYQQRVSGPDLMQEYCASAAAAGQSIFLLGANSDTLRQLQLQLLRIWPTLSIAGAISPPFRELMPDEDLAMTNEINASGAGTLFVGLGCPKQEQWMNAHRGRIHAVMVGVGAAFDFHAGTIPRAPTWMRNNGLEWLHRLLTEPRRLWRRYLVTNSLFVLAAAKQLMRQK
jgi:N-acetylglucosaminyldiphosphoundecaprenol N-acetyl-beta-D-mannosaminyltransferase